MKRCHESLEKCNRNVKSIKPHKTELSFDAWYSKTKSKSVVIPHKIEHPKVHQISVSESYRTIGKLIPYKDIDGVTYPLINDKEVVPAVNRHLRKCEHNGAFKTFYENRTNVPGQVPDGLHMFSMPGEITQHLEQRALHDIHNLFKHPAHTRDKRIHMLRPNPPPNNIIIFYNRDRDCHQPTFLEAMKIMYSATPALAEYIMIYFCTIREMLDSTNEEMEQLLLTLVHYDRSAGLNPHIDSIHMFSDTVGPIFTVAMGGAEKMIDMLPVLLPPSEGLPVRVYASPNEIMVMDGPARMLWAHSLPWRYPQEQFTVVFKFPELKNKANARQCVVDKAVINIPHYVNLRHQTSTKFPIDTPCTNPTNAVPPIVKLQQSSLSSTVVASVQAIIPGLLS